MSASKTGFSPPATPGHPPRPDRQALAPFAVLEQGASAALILAGLLALAPGARAQQPVRAAPDSPAVALPGTPAPPPAPAADQALGRRIAAQGTAQGVPACIACHGERGEGGPAFPHLAGTGSTYLREQLDAFADGSRANLVMQPIAQGLTPQERASLALYYSRLPPPPLTPETRADARPTDAGAWLAARGRWSDGLPACAQCHGPGGQGVGEHFPPLAGLPANYIADQLKAWRGNTRPPGPLKLMVAVAAKLSDADIIAVAEHYATLGRQASTVPATAAPATPAPARGAASPQKGSTP
ncbi:c-type cytochrome [Melaminivora sp.]|uniref:c-type cytochrome n=1 Tax=Melaminivora sp. TaxID=1933032 RepID=UPI0028ACA85C|nr:c-type cytochrome [Melaminivora sp.]